MRRASLWLFSLLAAAPCRAAAAADDLAVLSDDFKSPGSLGRWRQVYRDEGWGADQLERFELAKGRAGLVMVPYTSVWYQDWRGVLVYKKVGGDFVVTTHVKATGRDGRSTPASPFSLAGVMVRAPRRLTPKTWKPGGENYLFFSLGSADKPGRRQFEAKNTVDSDSNLSITDAAAGEATIRVARIGPHIILLAKPDGGAWRVGGRFRRADLPEELQVGMTCYTDWDAASRTPPFEHNSSVLKGGHPDLQAEFSYFRFRRPEVPAGLTKKDLSDSSAVSDDELMGFLGRD